MERRKTYRWSDQSWEVTRGCAMVSTACANCPGPDVVGFYAAERGDHGLVRPTISGYRWSGRIHLAEDCLKDPFEWPSMSRVVVSSNSDLFHESVPSEYIMSVFDVMANTDHTYLVSTKRPSRMYEFFSSPAGLETQNFCESQGYEWPLANVWIGTSVESQAAANHRIPPLISCPATVRFVSCMPLIEAVDLTGVRCPIAQDLMDGGEAFDGGSCEMCQQVCGHMLGAPVCDGYTFDALAEGVDWVIAGCEDGLPTRCRPMELDWVRGLREQCATHDTPFFYQQARNEFGEVVKIPFLDGRTHVASPYEGRRDF